MLRSQMELISQPRTCDIPRGLGGILHLEMRPNQDRTRWCAHPRLELLARLGSGEPGQEDAVLTVQFRPLFGVRLLEETTPGDESIRHFVYGPHPARVIISRTTGNPLPHVERVKPKKKFHVLPLFPAEKCVLVTLIIKRKSPTS